MGNLKSKRRAKRRNSHSSENSKISEEREAISMAELYENEERFPNPDEIANVERFTIGKTGSLFFGRVKSIYDGDTFDVVFSFRNQLDAFTVRLYGVDCPELKPFRKNFKSEEDRLAEKTKGVAAKDFVSEAILGKKVIVEIFGKDKYGRLLATIYFRNKETGKELIDLSEYIISNGHGYDYFGGKKR